MTYREALVWKKRKATIISLVGFALFVGGVWLAHQNVVRLAPQMVMLPGAILFVISVHYVRLFAFRCIHCGAAWESLATNQGLGIAKHIRYCPSCGCDIGAEMDQAQEAGAASQEPFFQLRQQQQSAMVAVSSPEDLTTGKSDVGRLWPLLGRIKGLELVLFCLAVIGLILSLVAHLCGSFGLPQPFGDTTWFLHVGIFVVWVPAIALYRSLGKGFKEQPGWDVALRGCPDWMRVLTYGFGVYAITNFITFALAAPPGAAFGAPAPPIIFRGLSGHWMAFYSAAAAILYSAWVVKKHDPARRCPNHHLVLPSETYCETCGAWMGEFKESDSLIGVA